jgi:hypothetical protein
MASWAPPLRPRNRAVSRLGGHVVPERELVFLAERLLELEGGLAQGGSAPPDIGLQARVRRDLDLLQQALRRSA